MLGTIGIMDSCGGGTDESDRGYPDLQERLRIPKHLEVWM